MSSSKRVDGLLPLLNHNVNFILDSDPYDDPVKGWHMCRLLRYESEMEAKYSMMVLE